MKDQILKIAKVKSEKEFYKKYPTEEAFMKAHKKEFKKAAIGSKMVEQQLEQLTDFGNPPIAEGGFSFEDALVNADAINAGITKEEQMRRNNMAELESKQQPSDGGGGFLGDISGIAQQFMGGGEDGGAMDESGALMYRGGRVPKAFGGFDLGGLSKTIGGLTESKGGLGNIAGDLFNKKGGGYKGIMEASQNMFKGQGLGRLKQLGSKAGLDTAGKAAGLGLLNSASDIIGGFGQMEEQKNAIKEADKMSQISDLTAKVGESQDISMSDRKYVRPENALVQPGQLGNPQGKETTYLANGGSIVDYMKSKGMNSSFDSRKKLYKNIFGESFNGKADQNLKLLNALNSNVKDSPFQKPSTVSSKKEMPTKKQASKSGIPQNITTPFTNPNYPTAPIQRGLESGVIVDKNTNEAYVIKGNKLVKQFPVLTGQSRNGENRNNQGVNYLEAHPENRVTPTGTYQMQPKNDIYGEPGYNLNPIPAFGYPAAEAKSIAMHVTYPGDFAKRNPMYSLPGEQRTASYGCPNCRKQDINSLTNQYFPQGDTTMVIDSRNQMDKNIISNLKHYEDGGWMNPDYNPQVIAKFGDLTADDFYKASKEMRSGGHFAQEEYTPPSAAAMYTDRAEDGTMLDSYIRSKEDLQSITDNGRYNENLRSAASSTDKYTDGRPIEKTDLYSITKGRNDNQRVKEFLRSQTGNDAPQYSMQKTYKPLFSDQYKTVNREIGAGRGERRMADMEQFLNEGKMEYGGHMAMGGELQTHWGGDMETISNNPFDSSEMVQFQGNDHEESNGKGQTGIGVTWGETPVEVEGGGKGNHKNGEIAVKMKDGGDQENVTVLGNMYKDGKKFKSHGIDIAKSNNKQNKIIDKSSDLIEISNTSNPFDQLTFNAESINQKAAEMQLKKNHYALIDLVAEQNAILDTASEYGLDSDALSKGKLKPVKQSDMAEFGAKLEMAQKGKKLPPKKKGPSFYKGKGPAVIPVAPKALDYSQNIGDQLMSNALGSNYNPIVNTMRAPMDYSNFPKISSQEAPSFSPIGGPEGPMIGGSGATELTDQREPNYAWSTPEEIAPNLSKSKMTGDGNKFNWKDLGLAIASGLPDFFRPNSKLPLDANDLMGEEYALANNQVDPVYAQTYQPMLDQPYNISLQDQINAVDAQANAAIRASGQNPAAQAYIMAQAIEAKNKIKGEEFRANQSNEAQTYQANRAAVNDSTLKNMGILDTQFVRQSQAKSNTKAQTQAALSSISDKIGKNKQENIINAIEQQRNNFRVDGQGRAINYNNPAQFNMAGNPFNRTSNQQGITTDPLGNKLYPIYNKDGSVKGYTAGEAKNGTKVKARNGSIVKALKSL